MAAAGPRPGDGDGWVRCALGHRHWGLFGAAGLLPHRRGVAGAEVLLQHRAAWSHHGGTWGLLGGARHGHESAVTAALREAGEEGGVSPGDVLVQARYDDDHGGWSYATVVANAPAALEARPTGGESVAVAWVGVAEVDTLELHPGLAASWPLLRAAIPPVTVVVDAANVVGSRPDGWWRDREGAARRLVADCGSLAAAGLPTSDLPAGVATSGLSCVWPAFLVVLEGAARAAAGDARRLDHPRASRVDVLAAAGAGDDAVLDAVRRSTVEGPVLVVTADRGLRERVRAAGAATIGPRWLLDRLPG